MLGKVKSFTTEDTEDTKFCREVKIPTLSGAKGDVTTFHSMPNFAGRLL